ncbi:hypothetical protein UFOVP410_17 [uncultured Caudovirales phage]|uniref:Uncharacterized protein n=1 Tax=uncultured Caudovirales phage TaxID=2100421 RepID=A0A6J5M3H7_9CAUD|nr:hypothetical protein UFOVP410_17 [uncultured Caudovirales phage]
MNIGSSNLITYIKQPGEILPIDISFSKLHILPKGALEISSATASAKRWKRKLPNVVETANSFLTSTTPVILTPNKTSVRITLTGGDDGYDYQVTVSATFDNSAKLEQEIFVRVRED